MGTEVDCTAQPSGATCIPGWSDSKGFFARGYVRIGADLGLALRTCSSDSLKAISPRRHSRATGTCCSFQDHWIRLSLTLGHGPAGFFPSLGFCPVLAAGGLCGLGGAAWGIFPSVGPGWGQEGGSEGSASPWLHRRWGLPLLPGNKGL